MPSRFRHAALVGKYQARGIRGVLEEIAHFLSRQGLEVSLERETALNTGITDFNARYPTVIKDVQRDIATGGANRVGSTPTYFINGVRIAGQLIPAEWFQKAIELELQKN